MPTLGPMKQPFLPALQYLGWWRTTFILVCGAAIDNDLLKYGWLLPAICRQGGAQDLPYRDCLLTLPFS
jgi:hypothetical protein|nr:hypothetical protein Q903MT_gene704 [Picea sitchensis]